MQRAQAVDNKPKFPSNRLATDRFIATSALRRNVATDQNVVMDQEPIVKCLTQLALLVAKSHRCLSVLRKVARSIA